jgi:eukaryotic translation initiation factor 2C
LTPNSQPLKRWGVAIVDGGRGPCVNQPVAQNFFTQFAKIYRQHGGVVDSSEPVMMVIKASRGGEMISDIWNATGNKHQNKPQLLFFVLPDKSSEVYIRIKKSCECRYGIVSQCLLSAHVQKAQDQYISNVCMKVNAKLGGSTCKAVGSLDRIDKTFKTSPTMIIGADVSHAAPGIEGQGSMAAITCSQDKDFTRYSALCNTNGNRVESKFPPNLSLYFSIHL